MIQNVQNINSYTISYYIHFNIIYTFYAVTYNMIRIEIGS